MEELIQQYDHALAEMVRRQKNVCEKDKLLVSGMVSDLEYALEWMKTGRQPGNRRGIERRAAYQRERPFDPVLMQRYFRSGKEDVYEWDDHREENLITARDRKRIDDVLSVLTKRELEVYLMSRGHCLSFGQIANQLCVSKGTVQKMIERAEAKITKKKKEQMLHLCG